MVVRNNGRAPLLCGALPLVRQERARRSPGREGIPGMKPGTPVCRGARRTQSQGARLGGGEELGGGLWRGVESRLRARAVPGEVPGSLCLRLAGRARAVPGSKFIWDRFLPPVQAEAAEGRGGGKGKGCCFSF